MRAEITMRVGVACAVVALASIACPGSQAGAFGNAARPVAYEPGPSAEKVARARRAVRERSAEFGAVAARLAQARARLDELNASAGRAVEAYNGEMVRLAAAERAHQEAVARLGAAEARLAEARAAVAALAAQSYGGVDLSRPMVTMMSMGGGGLPGYMHQASVLEHLSGARTELLRQMRDAQTVSAILHTQAQEAYDARQAAAVRAEQAKRAAAEAVERQRRETGALVRRKHELEARLAQAKSRAERLADRRAEALEAASHGTGRAPAWAKAGAPAHLGDIAADWALSQLGKPYVWAADGPDSYDCSGLTMRAWERAGIRLDHWTGTQWTSGPHVPLNQLRRGDLVFFGRITDDPGDIHHVGMYIGRGMMVHAPQTGDVVRIAPIQRADLVGATRPGT
ncbi:cell wall-associated NlpC family hydrolase [Thermocatellispora tengchongensis]|uniref:Cell wall-associated NlpC family hydrolase n=1 Tax=Thermocatellispora tengchongensis TaxID=1073253 RepID=A0A840PN03_9ACTN|nr:C40 family peptidase [Thermocatellispora tengchongensis]MBB5140422.1 cell wall-associated NlpC family hydrolase [Thermocatellispora tengchongensis]